jgi:hypothetical protein
LDELHRLERLETTYAKCAKLPGWETTDPRKHNPDNFRYFVQAESGAAFKIFESREGDFSEYLTNPTKDPEALSRRAYVHCSIVDQLHRATFGPWGFILDVPEENIRRAYSHDVQSVIKRKGSGDYARHLPPAQKILDRTNPREWNEIVVAGTNERTGSRVRIIGAFATIDPLQGNPPYPDLEAVAKKFAAAYDLPLVHLVEPILKEKLRPPSDD